MESDLNNRIERYLNRELHPAAARAMAHQALDDSDLFEELTAVALVQAALESPATTDRGLADAALDDEELFDSLVARGAVEAAVRSPLRRKYWPIVLTGAAVAALAAGLLTFFVQRPPSHPIQTPSQQAQATPPVMLSADLKPPSSPAALIFRGADAASRAPKSAGSVTSVEGDIAAVNLGSLDGIAKGTELAASRGHIVITTVFRDRARGKIAGQAIVNDEVRVPNAVHLGAVLQQVDALAASGNLNAARDAARDAVRSGSSGETRQLLERLAALDYQAGAADAARERYEVAVNNFDQPPSASPNERASTLANYGALALLNGDRRRAGELLQKALPLATDRMLRSQIVNNLGLANRP